MQLFSKEKDTTECFGSCGTELTCRCMGSTVRPGQQYRTCEVHGKYGSLCLACFSFLVAGTLS